MDVCLRMVQKCFEAGIGPAFLFLSTDRYGWVPTLPDWLPWQLIEEVDDPTLRRLYRKDASYLPPRGVIRPAGEVETEKHSFDEAMNEGRKVLLERGGIRRELEWSATEMEVQLAMHLQAAFGSDQIIVMERRFSSSTVALSYGEGWKKLETYQVFEEGRAQELEKLRSMLQGRLLPERFYGETLKENGDVRRWLKNIWNPDENSYLVKQLREGIERISNACIDAEFDAPGVREAVFHASFSSEKTKVLFPSIVVKDVIQSVREGLDKHNVCLLTASSGSGKSSIAAEINRRWTMQNGHWSFIRFCGTTEGSSTALQLMKSLVEELEEEWDQDWDWYSAELEDGGSSFWKDSSTSELSELTTTFYRRLRRAEGNILVIIDGLDQLNDNGTNDLLWLLPRMSWPKNVRLLLTTTADSPTDGSDTSSLTAALQIFEEAFNSEKEVGHLLRLEVPLQRQTDGRSVILDHLRSMQPPRQCSVPLHLEGTESMLTLFLLALRIARGETDEARKDVPRLIDELFLALEAKHGKLFTRDALTLLSSSQQGVSVQEWGDLLSMNAETLTTVLSHFHVAPERRVPAFPLTFLSLSLEGILQERGDGGIPLYWWFHRQFWNAAARRYPATEETLQRLLRYFLYDNDEPPCPRGLSQRAFIDNRPNSRRATEGLPCAKKLAELGNYEGYERWLTDTEGLYAICRLGRLFEVLRRLQEAWTTFKQSDQMHDLYRGLRCSALQLQAAETYYEFLSILDSCLPWSAQWLINTCLQQGVLPYKTLGATRLQDWGPCLFTISGKDFSIEDGAQISVDGRLVLTRCSDYTVRIWSVSDGQCRQVLSGHEEEITSTSFSPNGRQVLTSSGDTTARLWSTSSGLCIKKLEGHSDRVISASFSADGSHVVTASLDNTVRVWSLRGCTEAQVLEHHGELVSCGVNREGNAVVTITEDGTARIWSLEGRGCCLKEFSCSRWSSVRFSPTKKRLVVVTDRDGFVWDVEAGEVVREFERFSFAASSPDGSMLLRVPYEHGATKVVEVLSTTTGKSVKVWQNSFKSVSGGFFSDDGSLVAVAEADGPVCICSVESGETVSVLRGHKEKVTSVCFSTDNCLVVTCSDDRRARMWSLSPLSSLNEFECTGHPSPIEAAVISRDGETVATASYDGTARLWSAATGACLHTLKGHTAAVLSVLFDEAGRFLLTTSADATARLWSTVTGDCVRVFQTEWCRVPAISNDGNYIAVSNDARPVQLWSTSTGDLLQELKGHWGDVFSLAFSCDSSLLAVASADSSARIFSTKSGGCVRTLEGHQKSIRSVSFSCHGDIILTASDDETARVWQVATGECRCVIEGTQCFPSVANFCSDSSHFLTAMKSSQIADHIIRISETDSGNPIALLKGHNTAVCVALFSIDASKVVSTSEDGQVRVWSIATAKCLVSFNGDATKVRTISTSADAEKIVVAAENECSIRVWSLSQLMRVATGKTDA